MSYVSHEQHAACGGLGHSEIKPTESCQDSFAKESLQKLCLKQTMVLCEIKDVNE